MDMSNLTAILPPLHWIALEIVGLVLLAIGAAHYFGDADIVPAALRFEYFELSLMIVGGIFMIPAFVHWMKIQRRIRAAHGAGK
jgi:hypothetical protein